MVEPAVLVVEAEQQRADLRRCRSRSGSRRRRSRPCAAASPSASPARRLDRARRGAWRSTPSSAPPAWSSQLARDRGRSACRARAQDRARLLARVEALERCAALGERRVEQSCACLRAQAVEQDQLRRRLGGELADPALGRMEAHLQRVERQLAPTGMASSPSRTKRSAGSARNALDHFGEIARRAACPLWTAARPSSPSRKTRQRKPSHLGSNCQPCSSGSDSTSLASIGGKGGLFFKRLKATKISPRPTSKRRANFGAVPARFVDTAKNLLTNAAG